MMAHRQQNGHKKGIINLFASNYLHKPDFLEYMWSR